KDSTGSGDIFLAMIAVLYPKLPFVDCIKMGHYIAMDNLQTIWTPSIFLIVEQLRSYDLHY
ncbi:MAG: hypothetical protein ACC656_07065, partial [Candidatus Heimdallarchaeota archaeon]